MAGSKGLEHLGIVAVAIGAVGWLTAQFLVTSLQPYSHYFGIIAAAGGVIFILFRFVV